MLSFLATLAISLAATGPSPEAAKQATERVYKGSHYQNELPFGVNSDGTRRRQYREDPNARWQKRRAPRERNERGNSALGSISNMLLWLLTFVAAAVFALWFVREFLGYLPDAEAELEASVLEGGPSNTVVSAPLQDARLLAQQAQYGEAIHALLLRTLMELSRTYAEPLAPSLTSREILEALQLSPAAHDALTGLIGAVELCHFRGSAPGAEDYAKCLQHFEVFARAYVKQEVAA
tara:strand:- start:95385 stop:96092 length:708 start_codon:yes stop_codon:yes gene_type:complete